MECAWAGETTQGNSNNGIHQCLQPQGGLSSGRSSTVSKWLFFPYSLSTLQTAAFPLCPRVGESVLRPLNYPSLLRVAMAGWGSCGYHVSSFPTSFYVVLLCAVAVQSALGSSSGGIALIGRCRFSVPTRGGELRVFLCCLIDQPHQRG